MLPGVRISKGREHGFGQGLELRFSARRLLVMAKAMAEVGCKRKSKNGPLSKRREPDVAAHAWR